MLRTKAFLSRAAQYTQNHKKRSILIGVGVFAALLYVVAFFINKPVTFSYADTMSCTRQLTIFPEFHRAGGARGYRVEYRDDFKIGSFHIISFSTCFQATLPPREGAVNIYTAPFGGLIARKNFVLIVSAMPSALLANIKTAIPTSKPLRIPLSTPDRVHTYEVRVGKSVATCKATDSALECDVPALNLKQGRRYTFELMRRFEGEKGEVIAAEQRETLKAARVFKSSVKNKQIVYARPKTFTLTLDKPVVAADVSLTTDEKDKKTIKTEVTTKDKTVTITLDKELARSRRYRLILEKVEAADGSSLEKPYVVLFSASGGPSVRDISIGRNRVNVSDTIVLQFDQKISSKVSVASKIKLSGAKATISVRGSQVYLALKGMSKCQPFTITVNRGLISTYGIAAKDDWAYSSRTICHTVSTYGYSREGRPLLAYYFGKPGLTTLYVGGIHGNEPSSKYILEDWIDELESNPGRMPKNQQIVVVPNINPDGIVRGSRINAKGVNLNRNFPTDNWERNINDTDGYHKNGGGTKPLSEPEARALASLLRSLRPRLMMSYHAVGSVVVGDVGGYSASYAAKYASQVGYRNATGQSANVFDYSITGSFEDWAYRKIGVSNMVIELDSYNYRNFTHHREAFWAMLK